MTTSTDDSSPGGRENHRGAVLRRGALPLARFVADLYDQLRRKAPTLFARLEGDTRRTGGDLDGLIDGLRVTLQDPDRELRAAAADTLGYFGEAAKTYTGDVDTASEVAVAALVEASADADAGVREQVVRGLANFSEAASPTLVDRVSRATEDPDPRVRRAGIATLCAFGPTAPLPVVTALLRVVVGPESKDDSLMQLAIEGLQDCGQNAASEAVDTLAAIVCDARLSAGVRVAACWVLGWLGPEARPAGPVLADVLAGAVGQSPDKEVRVEAARALIESADLPALVAPRVDGADKRGEIVAILRRVGPAAAPARQTLQTMWEVGPSTGSQLAAPPASDQPEGDTASLPPDALATLQSTLESALQAGLERIEQRVAAGQASTADKEWYTVKEAATRLGKSEWTIRQACNQGRIISKKDASDHWRISHDELVKIQNQGLPK